MTERTQRSVERDTPTMVWIVWTEWGEYEQHSRDPRGVFASRELADLHAAQLRDEGHYDVVEVLPDEVLTELPTSVPYICWKAHITADGAEDPGLGFQRGVAFTTWSNEITSALGRLGRWDAHDLFIEVIGCDEAAVEAEYERLLFRARRVLAGEEELDQDDE